MLRRVYKTYSVALVMQKISTACQTFKNAVFSFVARFLFRAALFCNKPYQAFRFMCIQAVTYESPGCPGICFHQCPYRLYKVLFRAGGIQIWFFHPSCSNIEESNQTGGAMADIFKFHAGWFTRHYRFIRIPVFQCLDSCHPVYGYSMAPCLMDCLCIMVNGTDFIYFLRKCFRAFRFFGRMQPVTDEMRADFPHILKNGLWFLQKWIQQFLP